MLDGLLHRLERTAALDRVAGPLEQAARPVLRREPVSRLLSGTWLGHRLHPMLTDVVIGAWMSASLIDAAGDESARAHARRLVGVGIVSSLPTVASGVHDWLDYGTKVRRAGVVHALANATGLALQVASWTARRGGRHRRGAGLSLAGLGAAAAGGYLGGHLSYVLGAGVERTAFQQAPAEWTPTVALDELPEGPRAVDADGHPVLLVRSGTAIAAVADTCTHAGCSLAEGEVADGTVTCACHGSRFRLADGKALAGPAAAAQPAYEVRVRDGMVEVRERRELSRPGI